MTDRRLRDALKEIARLGEEGMKPDYNEWLTFHDKIAQIARAALSEEEAGEGRPAAAAKCQNPDCVDGYVLKITARVALNGDEMRGDISREPCPVCTGQKDAPQSVQHCLGDDKQCHHPDPNYCVNRGWCAFSSTASGAEAVGQKDAPPLDTIIKDIMFGLKLNRK